MSPCTVSAAREPFPEREYFMNTLICFLRVTSRAKVWHVAAVQCSRVLVIPYRTFVSACLVIGRYTVTSSEVTSSVLTEGSCCFTRSFWANSLKVREECCGYVLPKHAKFT